MKFFMFSTSCAKSSGVASPLTTNLSRQHSFTSTTSFHILIISLGNMNSTTFPLSPYFPATIIFLVPPFFPCLFRKVRRQREGGGVHISKTDDQNVE